MGSIPLTSNYRWKEPQPGHRLHQIVYRAIVLHHSLDSGRIGVASILYGTGILRCMHIENTLAHLVPPQRKD